MSQGEKRARESRGREGRVRAALAVEGKSQGTAKPNTVSEETGCPQICLANEVNTKPADRDDIYIVDKDNKCMC